MGRSVGRPIDFSTALLISPYAVVFGYAPLFAFFFMSQKTGAARPWIRSRASVGDLFAALFSMIVIGLFGIIRAIVDGPSSPVSAPSNHLFKFVQSRAKCVYRTYSLL